MVALSHLFTYFNSRPHGGRLFYRKLALRPHYFNSRPHGGRLPHPAPLPGASGFQLTPSRRATIFSIDILLILVYFNSRPHGGRLTAGSLARMRRNFNSRPHGGRRYKPKDFGYSHRISTHALTEGDTDASGTGTRNIISTHALTEGDGRGA